MVSKSLKRQSRPILFVISNFLEDFFSKKKRRNIKVLKHSFSF